MTEETNPVQEITKKIDAFTDILTGMSEVIVEHLRNPPLSPAKPDSLLPETLNKVVEEVTRMSHTLHSLETQLKVLKALPVPSSPVLGSRKLLSLCAVVSLSMTLLSVVSIHFLTQKNRYELSPHALQTWSRGRVLEKAWPKLSPQEREKIRGVPSRPNTSTAP